MKLLSSKSTFFYKRIFPLFWFGFLSFFSLVLMASMIFGNSGHKPPVFMLIVPIGLSVFGFFLMRHLVLDLIDEVEDHGTYLVFRNKGRNGILEEKIELSDIVNVSSTVFTNPPRVTLTLRRDTRLGWEISFSPPKPLWRLNPFAKSPEIEDLIRRIDDSR